MHLGPCLQTLSYWDCHADSASILRLHLEQGQCLQIHLGVPVAVEEDDGVRGLQVQALAPRSRGQQEHEDLAVGRIEGCQLAHPAQAKCSMNSMVCCPAAVGSHAWLKHHQMREPHLQARQGVFQIQRPCDAATACLWEADTPAQGTHPC